GVVAGSVGSVSRPGAASGPPSALPLVNSMTSGSALRDGVILASWRTASKLVCWKSTVTSGCCSLKISRARFQPWPCAEVGSSYWRTLRDVPSPSADDPQADRPMVIAGRATAAPRAPRVWRRVNVIVLTFRRRAVSAVVGVDGVAVDEWTGNFVAVRFGARVLDEVDELSYCLGAHALVR